MKKHELLETLTEFGLSLNEAQTYLCALQNGAATILHIAKDTGIKRSTVYDTFESLKTKGLMRIELNGMKKRYVAETPQHLTSLIEHRKTKLERIMPELASLYNLGGKESLIKYYEGLAGLKTVYENVLRESRLDDTLCVIAHQHEWLERAPEYFNNFLERRARTIRQTRLLFQESERARYYQSQSTRLRQIVKLFPSGLSFPADILITPRMLIIHQWKEPLTALVIENTDVVHTQQAIFDYIWKTLPD